MVFHKKSEADSFNSFVLSNSGTLYAATSDNKIYAAVSLERM
jgi:hypothetical protein